MNIMIDENNNILWQGVTLDATSLEKVFSKEAKNYPDGLLIEANDNSEHGTIVRVMDSARNIGITSISLSRS